MYKFGSELLGACKSSIGYSKTEGLPINHSSGSLLSSCELSEPISTCRFGKHSSHVLTSDADNLLAPNPLFTSIENSNGTLLAPDNAISFDITGQNSLSWYDNLTGQTQSWLLHSSTETILPASILNLDISELMNGQTAPILQVVGGTLSADTFTYDPTIRYNVYSGNGNVQFGAGGRDELDLSDYFSTAVARSFATARGGGVLFNPGNGTRVFDVLQFSNGNQILMEGVDRIRFADGILNLSTTPNDPGFSSQWNLHMMGVHNAWRFTTGSEQVIIGVQDSGLGVDRNGFGHPDLRRNTFVMGDNFIDDFESGLGSSSHGTAVQGIIAAASNNGIGMSGINWNSDVLNADVLGGDRRDLDLAEASQSMIDEANRRGDRLVINMSLGIPNSQGRTGYHPALERVVATNPNVLFVIASGNEDVSGISYPASLAQLYSNVMAVGASWGNSDVNGVPKAPGTRITYPGWWGSNYGNGLTLMGPSEVAATSATAMLNGVSFGYNTQFNGTSAATPNVTGVASLVWSANPNLTAHQVQTILSETAYDLGARGYDRTYGHGFVNADAAVRRALAIGAGAV